MVLDYDYISHQIKLMCHDYIWHGDWRHDCCVGKFVKIVETWLYMLYKVNDSSLVEWLNEWIYKGSMITN